MQLAYTNKLRYPFRPKLTSYTESKSVMYTSINNSRRPKKSIDIALCKFTFS